MKTFYELNENGNVQINDYLENQIYERYGEYAQDIEELDEYSDIYTCREELENYEKTKIKVLLAETGKSKTLTIYEKCKCKNI